MLGDVLYVAGYHAEASIRGFAARVRGRIMSYKLRLILALGAIIFALLVWPTLYRYDHIDLGAGRSYPVKSNRITGQTEILFPEGWKPARIPEPEKVAAPEEDVPPAEVAALDVHASLQGAGPPTGWGYLRVGIYNGSTLNLTEITVEITVLDPSKQPVVDRRPYRIKYVRSLGLGETDKSASIPPLQVGEFGTSLGFNVLPGQTWSCQVIGARGTRD